MTMTRSGSTGRPSDRAVRRSARGRRPFREIGVPGSSVTAVRASAASAIAERGWIRNGWLDDIGAPDGRKMDVSNLPAPAVADTCPEGLPGQYGRAIGGVFRPPCYRAGVETTHLESGPEAPVGSRPLHARWLGRIDYDDAYGLQKQLVDARVAGDIDDQLLLLEHPAVLTLGRNSDPAHILATDAELASRAIEVVRIERGGEVTYHGPGQLVAYPIIKLHERGLLLRPFVRALEAALIETCAAHGVTAARRDGHPGCWCDPAGPDPRKIGALGLRVERGVSYHGIALNVTTDVAEFDLIDPCGQPGVTSTSIALERGDRDARPSTASVEGAAFLFARAFASAIDAPMTIERR
jgi:lipoyl(octanoyl) transferase